MPTPTDSSSDPAADPAAGEPSRGFGVLVGLVTSATSIVAVTGAGVSTGSGLPDFRSPTGVWTRHDPRQMTFDRHVESARVRRAGWAMRREFLDAGARPNPAHVALAELQSGGRLSTIITQNIDELHQEAGATRVVELHGTAHVSACIGTAPRRGRPQGCGWRSPTREVLARVDAGDHDPACLDCGGLLKAATISFGQALDDDTVAAAWQAVEEADLLLAIGTSLQVHPAASLVPAATERGVPVAILNAEPTPFDRLADVVLRDPVEVVLPELVRAVARPG